MEEGPSSSQWPIFYACPACGAEVEAVAGDQAHLHHCPQCGETFVVASEDGSTDVPDEAREALERSREEELSSLRIRSVAKEKRALIRTQSYCIIGAAGCAVTAIQLVANAVPRILHHDGILRAVGYLLFAFVLVAFGSRLLRMSIVFYRESRKKVDSTPDRPPDFTKLSDGSQTIRNLEKLSGGGD